MKLQTINPFKWLTVSLSTLLLSTAFLGQALAEDDYAAEGERRAKLAGSELLGTPAPRRQLTTLAGDKINLGELYGNKPVYIKFWATWCVPCRQQMPGFEKIYQEYGDKLQVIAVNTGISDDSNSVGAFVKKTGLKMPVTIDDGSLARAFKLRVTPQHFLIDKNGRIAYVGHQDDEAFHQALEQVIAGTPSSGSAVAGELAEPTSVSEPASGYELGAEVTSMTLRALDNSDYPLPSPVRHGKATGLVFFAPWCEWYLAESEPKTAKSCQLVRERVEQFTADLAADDTTAENATADNAVQWLHLSSNLWSTQDDLVEYQSNYHTRLPIVFDEDGSLFERFGVTQLPTIVFIDETGKITEKVSLRAPDFTERLESLLADLERK
ncbi:redoxin family protein [Shewanella halotolerans]|uniref:redoxin family protein n=1 Tax=Shewanella halotolerans TaxID=2864204 RepID=UPI001C65E681|nr:redoxin family protein [Shewanella halotolerans]QYJ91090.1 redoxin family protein [Shewanella halotolerans]